MTAKGWDERWERRCEEARQLLEWKKTEWLQNLIRTMIETAELRHDEKLPSQSELMDKYGMSVTPVREAYNRLQALGRLRSSQGGLRQVHMPTERRHRLIFDWRESAGQHESADEWLSVAEASIAPAMRFLPADGAGPVTTQWREGSYTVPEWEAPSLGVDPGVKLLARVGTVSVGDERVLASISLVPPDIFGTTVRWSEAEIGELALVGVSTTFGQVDVQTRIPLLVDEQMLGIVVAVPVFAMYRPCRIGIEGELRKWPGCVLVVARGDRVSTPVSK